MTPLRSATVDPPRAKPTLRWLRLRAVWLLVLPFLWFARPTPERLVQGALMGLVGLGLRAWAAGVIRKEAELTTAGPYAYTRNPLYLGSLLLGLGVVLAGGRWSFFALFLAFFAVVYGRTMRSEEALLEGRFGDPYRHYAGRVPLLLPRLVPYRPPDGGAGRPFSLSLYRRNREYEALLGTALGFAVLTLRMIWM